MKQDINTILANLAVTIAEKEEDIKRLTERVKEQETVVLRGEDVQKHFENMMRFKHSAPKEERDDRSPAELRSDLRFMSEDMNELREKLQEQAEEYMQLRSEYIEKDALLSKVSNENNQRRLKIIDLEAQISALQDRNKYLEESLQEEYKPLSEAERIMLRQANTYLTDLDTIDWHRNFRVEEINTEDNHYTIFAFADNFDPQQKSYFQLRLKED